MKFLLAPVLQQQPLGTKGTVHQYFYQSEVVQVHYVINTNHKLSNHLWVIKNLW